MPATEQSRQDYPLHGYEYTSEGYHDGAVVIENRERLEWYRDHVIRPAICDGREVVITDTDDFAVFHTRQGVLLWVGDGSGVIE